MFKRPSGHPACRALPSGSNAPGLCTPWRDSFRPPRNSSCAPERSPSKLVSMSATRILWGQIIVVFTIIIATTWGATQWTAWRLGFQPELGPAWFSLASWPMYPPPAFFWWWYHFDAYAPSIFIEGAVIAASGGFASITVAIGMSVHRAREAKMSSPMARRVGRPQTRCAPRTCSAPMAWCSAESLTTICVMTDLSMSCVSRRPDPARASALSSRPYSPGRDRPSFTTSRARIGI